MIGAVTRTTVKGISLGKSVPCDHTSSWFAPRDKAAMLGVNTIEFCLEEFTWTYMKMESSQRREMFSFLTTNVAAVTSRADEA